MDPNGLVLIPISSKSKIIHMLVLLENIFSRSSKLQTLPKVKEIDKETIMN